MSPRCITVFVRRDRGMFKAFTSDADAIDAQSATMAARRCAARHFDVPESSITVEPDGEHVMIASVERRLPPVAAFRHPWFAVVTGTVLWISAAVWMISVLWGGGK